MPGTPCLISVKGLRTGPATQGDAIRITANFTAAGYDVDPTTVIFKAKSPTGLKESHTYSGQSQVVTRTSAGDYAVNFSLTDAGVYVFRWECNGSYQAAVEVTQAVSESAF